MLCFIILIVYIPHIMFIRFFVTMTFALIWYVYLVFGYYLMTNSVSISFVKTYMDVMNV